MYHDRVYSACAALSLCTSRCAAEAHHSLVDKARAHGHGAVDDHVSLDRFATP